MSICVGNLSCEATKDDEATEGRLHQVFQPFQVFNSTVGLNVFNSRPNFETPIEKRKYKELAKYKQHKRKFCD